MNDRERQVGNVLAIADVGGNTRTERRRHPRLAGPLPEPGWDLFVEGTQIRLDA